LLQAQVVFKRMAVVSRTLGIKLLENLHAKSAAEVKCGHRSNVRLWTGDLRQKSEKRNLELVMQSTCVLVVLQMSAVTDVNVLFCKGQMLFSR